MMDKTHDDLVKEMEERIKKGNLEFMHEIATPGVKTPVKKQ